MWIFLFLVIILAFDKAHWIHYCTRFTEEILHVLVALLFMYEGIKNLVKVCALSFWSLPNLLECIQNNGMK